MTAGLGASAWGLGPHDAASGEHDGIDPLPLLGAARAAAALSEQRGGIHGRPRSEAHPRNAGSPRAGATRAGAGGASTVGVGPRTHAEPSQDGGACPGWGGWDATKGVGKREWADGWNRQARCVPDPKDRARPGRASQWRELGSASGKRWRELHEDRRRVVRAARRAGYGARNNWARQHEGTRRVGRGSEVAVWTYTEGPAEGCEAVDPWRYAADLSACAAGWGVTLRVAPETGATVAASPRMCRRRSVCPVCAAAVSQARARALRSVIEAAQADGTAGELALVTLTQRRCPGETLRGARRRWRRAWRRMTGGEAGKKLAELVAGMYYGLEVTHRRGAGWHAHGHVVVMLPPGADVSEVREFIGSAWRTHSEWAGVREGLGHGWGWRPVAGGCRVRPRLVEGESSPVAPTVAELRGMRARLRWRIPGLWSMSKDELKAALAAALEREAAYDDSVVTDWSGRWWRPIPADDLSRVYQAAKYPTPIVDLRGLALAEFISVAYRKRWHDGSGLFRGIEARAAELEADGEILEESEGETSDQEAEKMPMGRNVGSFAPHESPGLDSIDARIGWERPDDIDARRDPPEGGTVAWKVANTCTADELRALMEVGTLELRRAGDETCEQTGEVSEVLHPWLVVPRAWVRDQLRRRYSAEQRPETV